MAREIKFRVWDKSNSAWIDGVDIAPDGSVKAWSEDDPSNDFVLCEWTGLKDKNGREIYEGDIVEYWRYQRYASGPTLVKDINKRKVVEWMTPEKNNIGFNITCSNGIKFEVIGNIYETPELLTNEPKAA